MTITAPPGRDGAQAAEVVLPRPHVAEVSVVVLAWRRADLLLDCLRSLAAAKAETPFDVVLVLNGATDAVRSVVAQQVRGATVVDSPVNLGYGGGCNLAASRSQGRYLLFLNDDTTVTDGWLDALVNRATSSHSVVAVTGRLLYPDGGLQEAGCRISCDLGPFQVGRLLPTTPDELLRPREVDYAGGAAALVEREAFAAVGGFPLEYGPFYYEDVDVSLRLRARGGRILYEPAAVAVHSQHGSTHVDSHFREFAAERARRLFERRWGEVLARAPRSDDPLDRLCDVPLADLPIAAAPALVPEHEAARRTIAWLEEYGRYLSEHLDAAREDLRRWDRALSAGRVELGDKAAELRSVQARLESAVAHGHAAQAELDAVRARHDAHAAETEQTVVALQAALAAHHDYAEHVRGLGVLSLAKWRLDTRLQARAPRLSAALRRVRPGRAVSP